MTEPFIWPDPGEVLSRLKDFQRRTAQYAFNRMYLDSDPTNRFLIADEVGLGKTLVAKGITALAIEHLKKNENIRRIDVVYICSNVNIARQNVERLNLTKDAEFVQASRITLLPLILKDLDSRRLNFIALTPSTSFELKSRLGIAQERVLLHIMLSKEWELEGTSSLNIFQGYKDRDRFREDVENFEEEIDAKLEKAFHNALLKYIAEAQQQGQKDIKTRFLKLSEKFARSRIYIPEDEEEERSKIIGELRELLAKTCIQALEPDLIILDEFQRFKHLLSDDTDAGLLAKDLFNYSDEVSKARVLLLSATPYKMCTLAAEENEDHYTDFLNTLKFLFHDKPIEPIVELLQKYRRILYQINEDIGSEVDNTRNEIESRLKKVMTRTERLSITSDRNGMLKQIVPRLELKPNDIRNYITTQKIAEELEVEDTMEYWKSAPYLLNFMDNYKIKNSLEKTFKNKPAQTKTIAEILKTNPNLLLSYKEVVAYNKLDPSNSRLRELVNSTVNDDLWKMLWLPPTLPYYEMEEPFCTNAAKHFTKRLVFSEWKVVPKVISTYLSYEAERLATIASGYERNYTSDARKKRGRLLRIAYTDGRLTGMPLFTLLYPSIHLSQFIDPLLLWTDKSNPFSFKDAIIKIQNLLKPFTDKILWQTAHQNDFLDDSWYWALPILMDMNFHHKITKEMILNTNIAKRWSLKTDIPGELDEEEPEEEDEGQIWEAHVERLRNLINGNITLGFPPKDIHEVIALMAIGSPAVTALRALCREQNGVNAIEIPNRRIRAAQIAWRFRGLFNSPEATAILRSMNPEEPYWRRVLEYCAKGGLQAVLDEYVHVLKDIQGLSGTADERGIDLISEKIIDVVRLHSPTYHIDEFKIHQNGEYIDMEPRGLRVHYALSFGQERGEEEATQVRADRVRTAFNSPFWPFILATTSLGQEGLDFHAYCHAVVHWNLPSNPVDLEQREGRVHRYKGHAVRKNIAQVKGLAVAQKGRDPWQEMFLTALKDNKETDIEIMPYWIYPVPNGAQIERHVPAMPLSRDSNRLEALRKSLVVYRMVFGQPRQDDLISYLLSNLPKEKVDEITPKLRIDLSPVNLGR